MSHSASEIIEAILRREGAAYTNHPNDTGGATKFGVTQATLSKYRGYDVTVRDVEILTRDEAVEIYQSMYVRPFALFQDMAPRLLGLLADSAVNHGVTRTVKWLQEAIGASADGAVGPATLQKWLLYQRAELSQDDLYRKLLGRRVVFYGEIVKARPDQAVFIVGWLKRACEFL